MLEEQQPSSWFEDALDLVEGDDWAVDGAEHERRNDRVDRVVVERQPFGGRVEDRHVAPAAPCGLLEAPAHRRGRLGEDELVEVGGVVREIETGAAAELERAAAGERQQ